MRKTPFCKTICWLFGICPIPSKLQLSKPCLGLQELVSTDPITQTLFADPLPVEFSEYKTLMRTTLAGTQSVGEERGWALFLCFSLPLCFYTCWDPVYLWLPLGSLPSPWPHLVGLHKTLFSSCTFWCREVVLVFPFAMSSVTHYLLGIPLPFPHLHK